MGVDRSATWPGLAGPEPRAKDPIRGRSDEGGFLREFLARPIEVLAGLIMLIAGSLLLLVDSEGSVGSQVLSTVLVGFAGVLLSYVGTNIKTKEDAAKEFRLRLSGIASQLAASVEQLRSALLQMQSESTTLETFSTVVSMTCQDLTFILSQIQPLSSDQGVSAEELARVQQTLEQIRGYMPSAGAAVGNGAASPSDAEIDELKRQLDDALEALQGVQSGRSQLLTYVAGAPMPIRQMVRCDNCDTNTPVSISMALGSSANTTCDNCGVFLNVHMGPEGVFSRVSHTQASPRGAAGVPQDAVVVSFPCPGCAATLEASGFASDHQVQHACVACETLLTVEVASGEVVDQHAMERTKGEIVGRQGVQPLTVCTSCGQWVPASMERVNETQEAELMAWCQSCHRLVGPFAPLRADQMADIADTPLG